MSNVFSINGTKSYGRKTANAGTAIVQLIEPRQGLFTHLYDLWYTAAATAHVLTVLRPLGKTTASAAASASQAVINFTADPGDYSTAKNGQTMRTSDNAMAGSDYIVYQVADGTYVIDTISSVSTLAVTMTTSVPTGGVLSGAPIWFFGIHSDTNPNDAQAHPKWNLYANVTTYIGNDAGEGAAGFCGSFNGVNTGLTGTYEPLIVYVDNASNAGYLEKVTAVYTTKG